MFKIVWNQRNNVIIANKATNVYILYDTYHINTVPVSTFFQNELKLLLSTRSRGCKTCVMLFGTAHSDTAVRALLVQ